MKKRYKVLIILGAIFVLFVLFLSFEGMKKLSGIDYMLLAGDDDVVLCHYDGDWYCGEVVTGHGCFVENVFWDNKYIVATAKIGNTNTNIYYVVEQLELDTFIVCNSGRKISWNKKNGNPWITEEYGQYASFCNRLQELNIDTTQMRHYSWKYWVGIY